MRPTGIVYPADYFKPRLPDSNYAAEADVFRQQGLNILTWDAHGLHGNVQAGRYLYRGWMQRLAQYREMYAAWSQQGLLAITSPEQYALTHYLPNWYTLLRKFTPETERLELLGRVDKAFAEELVDELNALQAQGWPEFFLKDDVKSLKTGLGSRLHSPEQAETWLKQFCQYRDLEGGVCIRRVESWLPESETRWFIYREQAFGPEAGLPIPEAVQAASECIDSPFFSVDVVQDQQGQWRSGGIG